MISRRPIIAASLLAALLTGCAEPAAVPDPAIGEYELRMIDGQTLPAQIDNGRVQSGFFHLTADQIFQRGYWRTNAQGGQGGLVGSEGPWKRILGDTIELTNTLGGAFFTFTATYRSDTLFTGNWIWVRIQ